MATVVAAVLVWAAASAQDASSSARFFVFEPTSVAAGGRLTVRTAGTPGGFTLGRRSKPLAGPIRLYLVRKRIADEVRSRFDRRLHFVGALVPDARGRGILAFRAPPLDSGSYVVAAWCPGCARSSTGRSFHVLRVDDQVVSGLRARMQLRLRTRVSSDYCPVSRPGGPGTGGDGYGNGLLATGVRGIGHSVELDGSIFDKLGWIPAAGFEGTLTVRGERLDAPSPPMKVLGVHWGYSSTGRGSWASAVAFPTEGCWRITGRVRDISLTFVARVLRP